MSSIGGGSRPRVARKMFVNDCCCEVNSRRASCVVVGRDHVRRDHRVGPLAAVARAGTPSGRCRAPAGARRVRSATRTRTAARAARPAGRRRGSSRESRAARASRRPGSPAPTAPAADRRAEPAARGRPAGRCRRSRASAAARGASADRSPELGRGRGRSCPGWSAASVPNCSAITSGEWFGSMIPPAPTLIVDVPAATCAITTAVAALAIPATL